MDVIMGSLPQEARFDEEIARAARVAAQTTAKLYDAPENEVSLTLTDNAHIHELNKKYRLIDRPTDVLSFALNESDEPAAYGDMRRSLGEIVISVERAKEQAEEYGHSLIREISFLTVHGMLHLLGYDHMEEAEREEMEAEQRYVMGVLGIDR